MAQSVFIEHEQPDGWKAACDEFLLYCYNECGIKSPGLHEGDHEYITPDNRAFKQISIPDHQWAEMYPAFGQWIAKQIMHLPGLNMVDCGFQMTRRSIYGNAGEYRSRTPANDGNFDGMQQNHVPVTANASQ